MSFAAANTVLARACTSPPPPAAVGLAAPVPAGQARAGLVRSAVALIGGPTARGKVGDYKLENAKVQFLIGAAGDAATGYSPYGGKVVDADLVRAPGEGGRSNFGEWVIAFDQHVAAADRVTVVSDGTRGGAAIVRVEGAAVPIPFFQVILEGVVPDQAFDAYVTIDYVLEPDADFLRVHATLENRGRAALPVQMRQFGLIFGDGADPWFPGTGFETTLETHPFFAAVAEELSYGIFDEAPLGFIFSY